MSNNMTITVNNENNISQIFNIPEELWSSIFVSLASFSVISEEQQEFLYAMDNPSIWMKQLDNPYLSTEIVEKIYNATRIMMDKEGNKKTRIRRSGDSRTFYKVIKHPNATSTMLQEYWEYIKNNGSFSRRDDATSMLPKSKNISSSLLDDILEYQMNTDTRIGSRCEWWPLMARNPHISGKSLEKITYIMLQCINERALKLFGLPPETKREDIQNHRIVPRSYSYTTATLYFVESLDTKHIVFPYAASHNFFEENILWLTNNEIPKDAPQRIKAIKNTEEILEAINQGIKSPKVEKEYKEYIATAVMEFISLFLKKEKQDE